MKLPKFIKKIFCDEIISITPPYEFKVTYRDKGTVLEGYMMSVTYKYAGPKVLLSGIDNDHFFIVSPEKARKNALDFYEKTIAEIAKRKKDQKCL